MAGEIPDVEVGVFGNSEDFNEAIDGSINRLFSMQGAILGAGAALGFFAAKAIGDAIQAMTEFETAMAGVQKVTGFTDERLAKTSEDIRDIAVRFGLAAEQVAEFSEAAARAGIRGQEEIAEFTRTVAKMDVALDGLEGDEVADQFARLLGFLDVSADKAGTVASVINELGNNLPTDAGRIIDAVSRMGSTFRSLGLTTSQIIGLAGATSTLQESSARAASGMRRFGQELLTPQTIREISNALGVSSEALTKLRKRAPLPTMLALSKLFSGTSEAGTRLADVIQARVARSMRQAGLRVDMVREALSLANEEFGRTQSINEEVAIFLDTVNKKWDTFQAIIHNIAIEIGQFFKPAVLGILGLLTIMAEGFRDINRATNGAFGALVLLTGAVFGAAIAIRSFQQIFRVTMGTITEGLAPLISIAKRAFLIVGAIVTLAAAWRDNWLGMRDTIKSFSDFVSSQIDPLVSSFKSFIGPVVQGFRDLDSATGGLLTDIGKFLAIFGSIGVLIGTVVVPVIKTLIGFLPNLGDKFGLIRNDVMRLVRWFRSLGGTGGILTRLIGVVRGLGSVFLRFAGPIGIIIGLATALFLAWKHNVDNFRTFVMKNLRQIGQLFQRHFGEVINQAQKTADFWRRVFIRAGQIIMRKFGPLIKGIAAIFVGGFRLIRDFLRVWGDDIVAISKFFLDILFGLFKFSIDGIATIFKVFFALLRGDWKAALGFIEGFLKRTFNGITSFIKKWTSGFVQGVKNAWNQVKQAIIDFANWLIFGSFIQRTFNAVTNWIKNSWAGKVVGAVSGVVSTIGSLVSDALSELNKLSGAGGGNMNVRNVSTVGDPTQQGRFGRLLNPPSTSSLATGTAITDNSTNINVEATIAANSRREGAAAARGLKDELLSNNVKNQID